MNVTGRGHKSDRSLLAALVVILASLLAAPAAHAAKVMFGNQEYLQKIQDVELKGKDGEALYLGYKYTHHAFVAPYRVTDDGYILGVVGQQRYYRLDTAAIEQFQARGLLPKPLPTYGLGLFDYVFGHLLWLIVAGIAASIYFSSAKTKRQQVAIPLATEALRCEQNGDWDGAIAGYSKALDIHPAFAEVLCRRANAYLLKKDFDRAISDFSKAIAAEPKNAVPLLGRGAAFEAKRLMPQAIADYSRAIKLSKAALAYFARGLAELSTGDLQAAIKDFTAAIDKEPQFAAAWQNRAEAHEQAGNRPAAEADRRRAAELVVRNEAAQPGLG